MTTFTTGTLHELMLCALSYHNEVHTTLMNKQIKQRWIEALRSGEYQQVQARLHTNQGYCCLGVLCDLYVKEHGLEWEEHEEDGKTKVYTLNQEESLLPEDVREWADLDDDNPSFKVGKNVSFLSRLNDIGYSFGPIAQIIEEQL